MIVNLSVPPIGRPRAGRLNLGMVIRVTLALAALVCAVAPSLAADGLALRGDVTVRADVLTLADLVDGVSGPAAGKPLFRAPAYGETGTIQVRRIAEAALDAGLGAVEAGGRSQVVVTRAARRIGTPEIEAAVKRALEAQHGVDARPLSVVFDGAPPALAVSPDLTGEIAVEELSFDRRTRRVQGLVSVGARPGERRASVRTTGAVVELVEVPVVARAVARGETLLAGDVTLERRPRDGAPSDALAGQAFAGQVARRSLGAGSVLRAGDLARPEIVARGEVVTIVYEVPGMVLTLRGRAAEAGAQGDVITVTNPQSKKSLQAQVVAPGKVSVSAALPGRVAAAPARP